MACDIKGCYYSEEIWPPKVKFKLDAERSRAYKEVVETEDEDGPHVPQPPLNLSAEDADCVDAGRGTMSMTWRPLLW